MEKKGKTIVSIAAGGKRGGKGKRPQLSGAKGGPIVRDRGKEGGVSLLIDEKSCRLAQKKNSSLRHSGHRWKGSLIFLGGGIRRRGVKRKQQKKGNASHPVRLGKKKKTPRPPSKACVGGKKRRRGGRGAVLVRSSVVFLNRRGELG